MGRKFKREVSDPPSFYVLAPACQVVACLDIPCLRNNHTQQLRNILILSFFLNKARMMVVQNARQEA